MYIEPASFFVDDIKKQLILTNFESCQTLDNFKTMRIVTLSRYIAPEVYRINPQERSNAADVFSLGVMLFNVCLLNNQLFINSLYSC